MGFPGATWRLSDDGEYIEFVIPTKLQRCPVGTAGAGDGLRVLYEVPTAACTDRDLIQGWCDHLSDKVWAEGTIEVFRSIANQFLNGGRDGKEDREKKTGSA